MSLMVILPSSSFFGPSYIFQKIITDRLSVNDALFAISQGYSSVDKQLLEQYEKHSEAWFKYAVVFAKKDAQLAYKLGLFYQNNKDINQAKVWFKQSSKQQHIPAVLALLKIYQQENDQPAQNALITQYKSEPSILTYAIELVVEQGNLDELAKLVALARQEQHHTYLLSELRKFYIEIEVKGAEKREQLNLAGKISLPCDNSIQFYATSLTSLRYAESLINKFNQESNLAGDVCFTVPRYITLQELSCHSAITEAIKCDESIWQNYLKELNTKYLAVILPEGGANVHFGILYLDQHDSYEVFTHEITHLLGFVDEYPLVSQHTFCQSLPLKKALNVTVMPTILAGERRAIREKILKLLPWRNYIKDETPILSESGDKWLLGTPDSFKHEVGLFPSRTCDNSVNQAYKALSTRTQLEYFEVAMPMFYLQLFTEQANKFAMPSFKHNVKLAQ